MQGTAQTAQLTRSAALTASSSDFSLNGLNRHSTAPSSSARGRTASSPWDVMNTIGILRRRSFSSRWRSGPVMPGITISRIRQRVWPTQFDARNSSADENARTTKPNALSKSGSDSRTDSSSSITVTSARTAITNSSWRSLRPSAWRLIGAGPVGGRLRPGHSRNGKGKRGSRTIIQCSPYAAMMTLDNGATDGQADTHTVTLCRVERIKESLGALRVEAHPYILHAQAHAIPFVSFRPDQQLSWTIINPPHRLQ